MYEIDSVNSITQSAVRSNYLDTQSGFSGLRPEDLPGGVLHRGRRYLA